MRARMALRLAEIKCEIREVRLSNKPDHMLEVSPKGTVPILILEDKVIDESIDIVNWVIKSSNIFSNTLNSDQRDLTESLIKKFDDDFKYHLDRYKYATRYKNVDSDLHKAECLKILIHLEAIASENKWIFGGKLSKLDISILPFIRQFRIANPEWFDSLRQINKIKKILKNYLDSEDFKKIMLKYDEWELGSDPVYFP
tara:strand:+ start:1025 stop:1621 length:597 start_codon:yes stop_codon:yes gene_type:complete